MSRPSSSERYKNNLLVLVDIFKEIYDEGSKHSVIDSNQSALFFLMKTYIKSCDSDKLINKFIRKSNLYWDKIYDKDIEYFKVMGLNFLTICDEKGIDHFKEEDNSTLVKTLSKSHLDDFKNILSSSYKDTDGKDVDLLDEEKKNDIWNIFHSFVKISICYLHENNVYPEINKTELAKKWKIKKLL